LREHSTRLEGLLGKAGCGLRWLDGAPLLVPVGELAAFDALATSTAAPPRPSHTTSAQSAASGYREYTVTDGARQAQFTTGVRLFEAVTGRALKRDSQGRNQEKAVWWKYAQIDDEQKTITISPDAFDRYVS